MEQEMKQYEALHWASSFLEEHKREKNVAEILLQHHLKLSRTAFYMQMRMPLKEEVWQLFRKDIIQHAETGVPVQHLTATATFYGRDFYVDRNVLVPRFETEELVYKAVHHLQAKKNKRDLTVVDVGTGSGVIAITMKLEVPDSLVYATDIAVEALQIAKKNARQYQADVTFMQGDFLRPIVDAGISPDVIISNPPYIAYEDEATLQDTVKYFDPSLALFADENGLAAYRTIIQQIQQISNVEGTMLFFEIGHEQGTAVRQLITAAFPAASTRVIQDMNEKDRIVAAELRYNV